MGFLKHFYTLLTIQLFTLFVSGYVITTPRKWSLEENNRVCVTLASPATPEDQLKFGIKEKRGRKSFLLPLKSFPLVQGQQNICSNQALPKGEHARIYLVAIGKLGGVAVDHEVPITLARDEFKTFIQTDKTLYKPLQTVQFRILSVFAPYLKVSTDSYEELWVENPSGSRIAQWLNVSNSNGLIHKSFQLSEEPEEGSYKIKARTANRKVDERTFKVEEYVLPKFEVILKSPNYIFNDADSFEVEVCAKYTFGQPVKGQLIFTFDQKKILESSISGCKKIYIPASDLKELDIKFKWISFLSATVKEEGTDIEIKEEKRISVESRALILKDLSQNEFWKPELPFIAKIQATLLDNQPAINESIEVCSESICKDFTTDDKGILKFVVPPHINSTIKLKAINYPWTKLEHESQTGVEIDIKKYHSPSNSALSIVLKDDTIDCMPSTQYITFDVPVHFVSPGQDKAFVSIQVVSRGQIQFSRTFERDFGKENSLQIDESLLLAPLLPSSQNVLRGSFKLPIVLPNSISPSAKVIVWYTRKDKEVVADTQTINVAKCLSNNVGLSWKTKKSQPGDPTVLSLQAEPLSLCSLGVVDKSVELLSSASNSLSVEDVFDVAKKSSVNKDVNSQLNDETYCRGKTSVNPFAVSGLNPPYVRKNALSEKPSNKHLVNLLLSEYNYFTKELDAFTMFNDAGLYVLSDQTLETRPCFKRIERLYPIPIILREQWHSPANSGNGIVETPTLTETSSDESKTRTYFPETWLWDLINISDSGEADEQLTLPDTVTEWVGSAICVHPSKGIGLSNKASITTFQNFFVDLTLPASIKVGETLPVKISVFNYLKESLPIHVVLEQSEEYEILADPKKSESVAERSSCVSAKDKVVHTIRIKPNVVGNVNITVAAQVDINSIESCGKSLGKFKADKIIKPIRVEFEGFEKESVQSKYICAKGISNGEDVRETWKLAPPPGIVADSARGFVSVSSDMMGPTIQNLGHLIKLPDGCGEQNMIKFAPNIFVMQYLESTNQRGNVPVEKALKYMEIGYQRELNYRHNDGSFSVWGKKDKSGSTWLTAFVIRCFAQAKDFISIDEKDLDLSIKWLKNLQDRNGCFNSVGFVAHKEMIGGFSSNSEDSSVLISSFVLISLIEAGQNKSDVLVREAIHCLKASRTKHPYTLALLSYAFALADSRYAQNLIERLFSFGNFTSSSLHWEFPGESSSSLSVETAGYAVLALLKVSKKNYKHMAININDIPKILKWINSKRNAQGGFISTQDTVVALQALAEYQKTVHSDPVDLTVFVQANQEESHFLIDETNKFLQQKTAVSKFPADISFDLVGSGCVLLQALLRYNIPYPEPSETFNVTVETKTVTDDSCKTKNVNICVSYILEDEFSNMGIMEVKLVSGYIPKKEDLKALVRSKEFKRYEIDGSLVTLYVDEFGHQPTCASFDILREVDVENAKPGSVKVYDYYTPEYFVTEKYELSGAEECVRNENVMNVNETLKTEKPPKLSWLSHWRALSPPLPPSFFGKPSPLLT